MTHPSIRLEGSILSADILDAIERGERAHQAPKDFGLDPSTKVKDEIADAWAAARAYWAAYQVKISRLKEGATGTTETRNQWLVPLLGLLGYQLTLAESETLQGKTYRISHRDPARDQLPVHLIGWHESLDRRSTVPNAPRMSPHGLVQEYLNLTEHLYGIVSNGRLIRLLRDSSRLVKLTFIEFDLERIFTEELFSDFALLYRLLHASRLPVKLDAVAEAPIEIYHQDSLDSGSRIRDGLSKAVHTVILNLGNGFLANPTNEHLRELAANDPHSRFATDFYAHLLRLIYRLLFLMVIEERGLVHTPGTDKRLREIYDLGYSLARLRRLAEKPHFADARHHDAWLALVALFRLVDESGRGLKLGVAPLGGDLFNSDSLGLLEDCSLDNATFLTALRQLTLFTNPVTRQLMRVNYGALNVEEFGSVYQGLLEFKPRVTRLEEKWHFAFAQGDERSATGSHYTEDVLVQPLLKHSLDHLINDCIDKGRRMANGEWRTEEEKHHAYQLISRLGCLEPGSGPRREDLRNDPRTSTGRALRSDQPNAPRGGVDPVKHSGGLGTPLSEGVHQLPSEIERQPDGTGNPTDHRGAGETSQSGNRGRESGGAGNHREAVAQSGTISGEANSEWRVLEEANGELRIASDEDACGSSSSTHSPLTTHRSPDAASGEQRIASGKESTSLHSLFSSTPFATRHSLLTEDALLRLRVADISCGSGHILLAAARRIGLALAIVRTGDDQPSPAALREATRDVIKNCIYGVDLNPLAVELCKVALWLEAHSPGEPLNFLDHHIKCGNAIVGFVTQDALEKGVPDEAFKTLPGDDKDIAAAFRKTNKAERLEHTRGQKKLHLAPELQQKLNAVLARWREISALPEHNPAEIAAKKKRYDAADGKDAYLLRQIAAIPIAQFYQPKTAGNKACLITDAGYRHYLAGQTPQGQATASAWHIAERKRAFHWFLEFPDIIARGGFDCILGNPPYLGGKKLSTTYGKPFLEFVLHSFSPAGSMDLVGFFLRRMFHLTRVDGFVSLITTNTISQGDTREGSLQVICDNGGTIVYAHPSKAWPGQAAVSVTLLSIKKGTWILPVFLEQRSAPFISTFLDDAQADVPPLRLEQNKDLSFVGSFLCGTGFLMKPEEAKEIVRLSPTENEVLFPYFNGEDLNQDPSQSAARWTVNFSDWDLVRVKTYPECFSWIDTRVKPKRTAKNEDGTFKLRSPLPQRWWMYADKRPRLYQKLGAIDRTIAIPETTKYCAFNMLPTGVVFSHMLKVIATDDWSMLAILSSTLHELWARKYSSTLETRLKYSPSDCFETFAFPAGQWQQANPELAGIGERYHEFRRDLMLRLWLGLTDIYNLFHDPALELRLEALFKKRAANSEWRVVQKVPAEHIPLAGSLSMHEAIAGIKRLRQLHVELDYTVLAAYGWAKTASSDWRTASREKANSEWRVANERDKGSANHLPLATHHSPGAADHSPLTTHHSPEIVLSHDFYQVETLPENDRTRYTITPQARKELLTRLLKLNHQRAAEEAAQAAPTKGFKPQKPQRAKKEDEML